MSRHVTQMTLEDALHYTPERRREIEESYPPHLRDAKVRGIPQLGSGRIYPFEDARVLVEPFEIPSFWPVIGGLDFGWEHPTAAVLLAWDRDRDVVYVTHEYRVSRETALVHTASLKSWGDWIPWAWPHDGLHHDKGQSGEELAASYRKHGLNMHPEHATHESGGYGREAGIEAIYERIQMARFRVFAHCTTFMDEMRFYHRKDGKVVDKNDDLLDAARYAVMMLRFARTKPRPLNRLAVRAESKYDALHHR